MLRGVQSAYATRLRGTRHRIRTPWQLVSQPLFSNGLPQINEVWQTDYQWSPPVTILADTDPPTALQWARRRGPALNHAQLHSLFRKRQIKLFIPAFSQVKSVSERAQLPEGSCLLIPKQAIAGYISSQRACQPADLTTGAALALAEQLRHEVLYKDHEMLVMNKPAGLAVQGGPGIRLSLDKVMGSALSFGSTEQLRLVHRLDKDASGCLVIARTADSAAWLSQAFAQHASAAANPGAAYKGATVQREYSAVVENSQQLALSPQGTISEPLMGPGGSLQPATTHYHMLRCNDDVALMKLTPKTGRKHQLRIHCARALSAPILGDTRYGMTRNTVQRSVLADLKEFHRQSIKGDLQSNASGVESAQADPAESTGDTFAKLRHPTSMSVIPLQLHCHAVCIQKPGQPAIKVTAEPPYSMKALMRLFCWE